MRRVAWGQLLLVMTQSPEMQPPSRPSFSRWIGRGLRRYFLTGLATLLPVVITLWLVFKIFEVADGFLGKYLAVSIPGLGLLVTCLAILLVGVVSIHFFGHLIFQTLDVWFSRIPLIKSIYPAVKQIAQFLFSDGQSASGFRRVVLIEFPRPKCYAVAFVTCEAWTTLFGERRKLLTLLVPNPPSPLSGPVIFLPEEEVIPLTMTVEEALKLIVSGGVVGAPLEVDPSPNN